MPVSILREPPQPLHQQKRVEQQISKRTQDTAIAVVLGHEAAVAVADAVPHHVVAHLRRRRRRRRGGWIFSCWLVML